MYENFNLNMTMKPHIIYHHLEDSLFLLGETFHAKSDEIVESTHSKLKEHEQAHNCSTPAIVPSILPKLVVSLIIAWISLSPLSLSLGFKQFILRSHDFTLSVP